MRKLIDILRDPVIQLLLMLDVVIMIGISIAAPNADRGQPNRFRAEAGGMVWAALTSTPTETPWPTVTAWLDGQPTAIPTQTPWPTLTPIPWPTDTPTLWIPTSTPWATEAATATLVPMSTPTAWQGAPGAGCDCSSDTYNCPDFTDGNDQACFEYCMEQGAGDIHRLDWDNDLVTCEDN